MNNQKLVKLNLGSGQFKKEGYVNVDNYAPFKPDVVCDLDTLPYPFENDTFDVIEADHVLEHLEKPLHTIREMYRIAKPDGIIQIRVPHFSRGFSHPEHKNGFDVSLPYYFNPIFTARYENDIVMELVRMRLHWSAQPHIKKLVLSPVTYYGYFAVGWVIDLLANISPSVCSRVWCFWVGGFEEIEYVFKATKETKTRAGSQ